MPVKKEREYRTLVTPLTAQVASDKRINTECYVEGYATTFNAPYLLYEFEDGTKIYERIDAHALDNADMSDVIMQYDHTGRVFARQSNKTLILEPDAKGLFVAADLSKTDLARGLYQDIDAGRKNLFAGGSRKTQKFTCKNCCGRAYRRSRHRTYDIQKLCRSRRNGCSSNRARG